MVQEGAINKKNNYDLELFPEHPFDRDVNPVKLSKYATGYEYV